MKGRTPPAGRTGQGTLSRLLRWLLAALTLLAAAAFQARAGGSLPVSVAARAGTHDHHAPHPLPGPTAAHHAAHCLFCLTGAFALEPGTLTLRAAPPWPAPADPTAAPQAAVTAPSHADARAPPRLKFPFRPGDHPTLYQSGVPWPPAVFPSH